MQHDHHESDDAAGERDEYQSQTAQPGSAAGERRENDQRDHAQDLFDGAASGDLDGRGPADDQQDERGYCDAEPLGRGQRALMSGILMEEFREQVREDHRQHR